MFGAPAPARRPRRAARVALADRHSPEVEALAQQRFVEAFLKQAPNSQRDMFAVTLVVTYLWWQAARNALPFAWFAASACFLLWRYLCTERVVRRASPERREPVIRCLLLASGCMQAIPLLSFTQLSDTGRVVLTLVPVTLATGAVMATSGFRGSTSCSTPRR